MKALLLKVPEHTVLLTSSPTHLILSAEEGSVLGQIPVESQQLFIPLARPGIFATMGYDKKFRLWLCDPKGSKAPLQLLYSCSFPKKLTHGTACELEHKEYCFIADKFGDVYIIDVDKAMASANLEDKMIRQDFMVPVTGLTDLPVCKFIMGHQEVITQILISPKKDFIVTIDKASKIKVSHVPHFHNIHAIYFGHHAEIVYASFLSPYELLTLDQKNTLILWDITQEDAAMKMEAKLPVLSAANSFLVIDGDSVAIGFQENVVTVLEIKRETKSLLEKCRAKVEGVKEICAAFKTEEGKIGIKMVAIDDKTQASSIMTIII